MIAPGRWADMLLVDDLQSFRAEVRAGKGTSGRVEGGRAHTLRRQHFATPPGRRSPCTCDRPVKSEDLVLRNTTNTAQPTANVIGVSENQLTTRHMRIKVTSADGEVAADMEPILPRSHWSSGTRACTAKHWVWCTASASRNAAPLHRRSLTTAISCWSWARMMPAWLRR